MVQSVRGCGRHASCHAKPLTMGTLPACSASKTANWIAAAGKPCGTARRFVPRCHGMRAVGSLIETGMVVA